MLRRTLPFAEDMQRASREQSAFCWVASPALLKRMGDNLDWPALRQVRRVFSSGGPLPAEAAQLLRERLGQWPTEIYGSSETGGIAWRRNSTGFRRKRRMPSPVRGRKEAASWPSARPWSAPSNRPPVRTGIFILPRDGPIFW